jgi:hypothetical protein
MENKEKRLGVQPGYPKLPAGRKYYQKAKAGDGTEKLTERKPRKKKGKGRRESVGGGDGMRMWGGVESVGTSFYYMSEPVRSHREAKAPLVVMTILYFL